MSGEFGSYSAGHFWQQMECAAEDLASGRDALTREWAAFFEAFAPVAKAISWSEACDTGPDHPICVNIDAMEKLRAALSSIGRFLEPYKRIRDDAVRKTVSEVAKDAGWTCAARRSTLPEPADCNWPLCGCDPAANKVLEALQESGLYSGAD